MALIRKDPGMSMFRHIETVFQMGQEHILEGDPKWHPSASLPDDWDTFKVGLYENAITQSFLAVVVDIFVEDKRRRNISPTRGNLMEDPELSPGVIRDATASTIMRDLATFLQSWVQSSKGDPIQVDSDSEDDFDPYEDPEEDFDPDEDTEEDFDPYEDPEEDFEMSASDMVPPQPPLPDPLHS